MKKSTLIILFTFLIIPLINFARKTDSISGVKTKDYKNVIKFNPTPMLLWDARNLTFSYERILAPNMSVSLEAGYLVLPMLVEDTLSDFVNITSHHKDGINITTEYRFYLTRLNTRSIPAGLYIGPYLTFYGYKFNNDLQIMNPEGESNGMIKGQFWSFNLGAELGYQFVLWKRLTLDLVMVGPSISYYGGQMEITGQLTPDQITQINEDLYNKLAEKFPFVQSMSIDKSFKETGKLDMFRLGFRYLVQIGFRF
jgi:hypothetical protein